MDVSESRFLVPLRAQVKGRSNFSPDFIVASRTLDSDLVESPFVIYDRAWRVKSSGAEVLAETRVPYFNRDWDHFCSHQHAPFRPERNGDYDGLLQDGEVVYFSHPIFGSYYDRGQPLLKYLFRGALRRLLPESERELAVALPSSGRVSLMEQVAENRLLLHLLYCQPQLRGESGFGWAGRQKMEIIEDAVPVFDVTCRVRVSRMPVRVLLASTGLELPFDYARKYLSFKIPKVDVHELVAIEFSRQG